MATSTLQMLPAPFLSTVCAALQARLSIGQRQALRLATQSLFAPFVHLTTALLRVRMLSSYRSFLARVAVSLLQSLQVAIMLRMLHSFALLTTLQMLHTLLAQQPLAVRVLPALSSARASSRVSLHLQQLAYLVANISTSTQQLGRVLPHLSTSELMVALFSLLLLQLTMVQQVTLHTLSLLQLPTTIL